MAEPPSFEDLKADLSKVRQHGITKLRSLELPSMTQAAHAAGLLDANADGDPPIWETLLREALDELTGTRIGDVGGLLFGLEPGTRGYEPHELRRDAAERWGVSEERFRRDPQSTILSEIAEAILRQCVAYRQRQVRLDMERKLPTSSRLAVKWLERFDSYHRIWTPVYALGADLTAYRHTLIEPDRPYDNPNGERPDLPIGYTQESQAAGYMTFALFHYTEMLIEVQAFRRRYGGQWLLSDPQAEDEASNAIHTIEIESSNNERDDSYLRDLYTRTNGELHPFLTTLAAEKIGMATHGEWQQWAEQCDCMWDLDHPHEPNHYPTRHTHSTIQSTCPLHRIVKSANDYCNIIDDEWRAIGDWYRIGEVTPP